MNSRNKTKLDESEIKRAKYAEQDLIYGRILAVGFIHISAIYGLYLGFCRAKWSTILFNFVLLVGAEIGVTAGAHRLWSHRAYKAKLPLQIILMLLTCIAFQFTPTNWARDHRLHHKCSDTDGDPHNASRGFFYSHIGWILMKKHPDVKTIGKEIDMSDLHANPVLRFQEKYVFPLIGLICFLLPTVIPMYFWKETLNTAWHVCLSRYVLNLHCSFLINSAAHLWGNKPYDKSLNPTQNWAVSFFAVGEGFHNYHHAFPWDYKAAELGNNYLNLTTKFIDFFAWIGWAYDLKTVPEDMIRERALRTGDGTDLWGNRQKLGDSFKFNNIFNKTT